RIPELFPEPPFGVLPMRLSQRDLPLAGRAKSENPLSSVVAAPDLDPTLPPQQGQRPRQRRAVHGKARAQELLIAFAHFREGSEQSKLGDLYPGLPQFLVVNPRHDTSGAPKVLAGAGQREKFLNFVADSRVFSHM